MNYKIVVNKEKNYDKTIFSNIILEKITNSVGTEYFLEKKTLKAYYALKKSLEEENIYIDIVSGYRNLEKQQEIIDESVYLYGKDYTDKYVAKVGASEHHTGLCLDISLIIDGNLIIKKDQLFKKINILDKVKSRLKDFGFILRYPKGKENITGYNYKPWHLRYVTKSTAKIIIDNNMTLEEYDKLYNRSGILIVNKEKGVTSRDVINKLSLIYDTKKIGHNGTLDPLATGVLVVTINKATKINELLTASFKEYIATAKIGILTDTLDITGNVIRTSKKEVTKEMLLSLFANFDKSYFQEVPKFSAIKIRGKKLYEYARGNINVTLPKRKVEIKELELLEYDKTTFKFRIVVSKGTYIRSIIRDMGEFLDIPCTMENLVRTKQGKFTIDMAKKLEDININTNLIKIEKALDYKTIEVKEKDYKKIINGASIYNSYNVNDKVIFKRNDKILAIYQKDNEKLRSYKMFI